MFIADTSFFLARHVLGPQNTRTLTVLGWTDDIKILNATLYPAHVQNDTPEFMTTLYNIGRLWLGAATILPPKHIHDPNSPCVPDPDNFSTFRPQCTRYNPPGSERQGESGSWICFGGNIVAAPSHRRPMLYSQS